MSDEALKDAIMESLWQVVDRHEFIQSATLTGSFVNSKSLEGLSDIDLVVIVDQLNQARFTELVQGFQSKLETVLRRNGYRLRINPTLGPLKFNEPKLAVLHLMLYSSEAHVEHVIQSPFTCLDWQHSTVFRKQPMATIYPAFGLQPRHFLSARRSISDYLKDFRDSEISFRELQCHETGYSEKKCTRSMDNRDRHEFAYHIMRFLMLNLLKLTRRWDDSGRTLQSIMDPFFAVFPLGQEDARPLLEQLADKKRRVDYVDAIEHLGPRLERFVSLFEVQFREVFIENASRHLVVRHAPTKGNMGPVRFQGRSDLAILELDDPASLDRWDKACKTVESFAPEVAFVSPLLRCRQTMEKLMGDRLPSTADSRLIEIDYGQCEMLTTVECQGRFPKLFDAWQRSEDPRFPGGENTQDVHDRVWDFAKERWSFDSKRSITCTHNGVLRCLVGQALGIPPSQRYRIQIPHLAPIEFISTKQYGVFVNLEENVEREMLRGFVGSSLELKQAC